MQIFESVPNISEGRDRSFLQKLAGIISSVPQVRLLDWSADADHNRSVFTFIGTEQGVFQANLALCTEVIKCLSLPLHSGVHPRLGIVDVMPIIPVHKAKMDDAVRLSRKIGTEIEQRFAVPVYYYEYAAVHPELRNLADVRRLKRYNKHHPTAGAICIGARDYLVAYNINLQTADSAVAKEIAAQLREKNGGLPGVKAIGLYLETQQVAQVSMNLVDPLVTTPQMAYARVAELAAARGVRILNEEYIGLTPEAVLAAAQLFEQEQ